MRQKHEGDHVTIPRIDSETGRAANLILHGQNKFC